ncbi:MAG TPA: flagellar biosynthetic protein FliO [Syntrophorhabdaceae bacterium]|nr:flagellar biosynthetic protein FliO [Syntrophorhabdaceae bacterium]
MSAYIDIVKVIFILLFIVTGMILLYRYSEKLRFNLKKGKSPYRLKRIDTIYLGPKKTISIVEVEDYVLVLGVGEKDIRPLLRWKKTKEKEE